MTVLSWGDRRFSAEQAATRPAVVAGLVFLALAIARSAIQYRTAGALFLEDDAFYYTVIAQHIAQSGVSTFDGQSLTNGYHPLWLLLLVAQDLTVGPSVAVTIAIELALASVGVALLAGTLPRPGVLLATLFGIALSLATRPFIARGMEVSLLIFAAGLFTQAVVAYRAGRCSAPLLGLAAAGCIGARIDAAVFVLPVLALTAWGVRPLVAAALPVAVGGALYAGLNLVVFGIAFPVSGAVKSLGGLQINHHLLDQIALDAAPGGTLSVRAVAASAICRCLACAALCVAALPFTAARSTARLLIVGFLLGFAIFAAKLLFGSSWRVWPWYTFPVVFGLTALFHTIGERALAVHWRLPPLAGATVGAALLVGAGWQVKGGASVVPPNFELLNRQALRDLAPVLRGERIAMGDRAGSVAAFYDGPVTQLEGLVNDKAYLQALERGDDLRPLLCRRGVRFLLSYQRDLGDYRTVTVPAIRPWLAGFKGPALTVARADEVGRVANPALFDLSNAGEEGDSVLYAWRLAGCDAPR